MASSPVLSLLTFLLLSSSVTVTRSDYPPPSEDGHGYYRGEPISRTGAEGGGGNGGGGGSFVTDWSNKDWSVLSGGHNHVKCLTMPPNLTLCAGVGYSEMRLPNLLQHDTLKELTQQASSWVRLSKVGCHPDTQKFLCSLFAPICLDQTIWPCRALCEAVKSGCESKMLKYGFPWPDMLRCDQFPDEPDLCIGIQNEDHEVDEVEKSCPACSKTNSYDAILSHLCKADFVMRIKVEQSLVADSDIKIVPAKKKKIFRTVGVKAKELRDGVLFVDGGARCDCPPLDTVNGRRSEGQLIVAGNRTRDRLVVFLIQAIEQNQGLRRALNDIRKKDDVCGRSTGQTPRRTHPGSSGGKSESSKKQKKKNKKDKKSTTPAIPNNRVARPSVASTSHRGSDKVSNAQQNPSGSGDRQQGKGKSREGRQHTAAAAATSPKPQKKSGQRKGQ